jgi:hypothetical protein
VFLGAIGVLYCITVFGFVVLVVVTLDGVGLSEKKEIAKSMNAMCTKIKPAISANIISGPKICISACSSCDA